jgi:L-seryl-tRNA(Ser) seleniumtransferase
MLVGRRELVEAAWLNHMAGSDTIGRQMKIGKEEIVGLLAAVERFVRFNHDEEERRWTKMLQRVARRLSGIRSVEARFVPEDIEPPHVPRLYVRWDEQAFGLTAQQVIRELAEGDPHIYVRHTTYGLTIVPVGIQAGEEETIARRLRQILLSSSNRLRPSSMV